MFSPELKMISFGSRIFGFEMFFAGCCFLFSVTSAVISFINSYGNNEKGKTGNINVIPPILFSTTSILYASKYSLQGF